MGLFSKSDNLQSFLGVDIGGSSIKLIELSNNNGRAQLVTYGYLERSLSPEKLIEQPERTGEVLRKIAERAKVVSHRAIAALPNHAVFSSVIVLPEILKKDLASHKKVTAAVEWEAKKILPRPLEEMILDWKIISGEDVVKNIGKADKIKDLQILVTAAAKDVVQKYIDIFKKAGIELISLETESFALARSMVGKDKSLVILVDIGATSTDIFVIENSLPLLARSVKVGGLDITKSIASVLGISLERAEQFKRDLETSKTDFGNLDDLPEIFRKPVRMILNEVEYTKNFYLDQPENKNKRLERIVLSGGTALLLNLPQYFSNKLNMRTFVGNPWARIIYPEDLQPVLESIGPRMATCIGLAMRDIE